MDPEARIWMIVAVIGLIAILATPNSWTRSGGLGLIGAAVVVGVVMLAAFVWGLLHR